MRARQRHRLPDGTVVATYRPHPWGSRLYLVLQYLGLLPGWPEPDDL